MPLTAERLRAISAYNPVTGSFVWTTSRRGVRPGAVVGGAERKDGYCRAKIDGKRFYVHRLVWLYVHGQWPCGEIDHINGNREDNRLCNLRDVQGRGNQENRRRANKSNNCGVLGVSFSAERSKYAAQIHVNRRRIFLGRYASAEQAHKVYLDAKRRLHQGCTL